MLDMRLHHRCVGRCASSRLAAHFPLQRNVRVRADNNRPKSDNALSTLDSLLGESGGSEASLDRDPNLVEWWRVRPRQSAPPRTTSVSSSKNPAGRFIANEEMLRNEVWAGQKTLPGQALELPKVTPYISYAVGVVNMAVYGTLVRLYDAQGPEATAELLSGIVFSSGAAGSQFELWRLLTGCFVQPDLASLAVVLFGSLVVAPRVEASLGYRTFAAAFLLSTLVAADAVIALGGGAVPDGGSAAAVAATTTTALSSAPAAAAAQSGSLPDALLHPVSEAVAWAASSGASGVLAGGLDAGIWLGGLGAAAGLAGCAAAHEVVNGDVERKASGGEASTSGSTGGGGGSRGGLLAGGVVPAGLLAAGGVAATLLHAGQPGVGAGGTAMLLAGLGAGFGTGFLLASVAGPRYQVTREVELPEGSMWIPDPDAVQEVTVVLDQTTSLQRTVATGGLGVAAVVATALVLLGGSGGVVR